MPMEAGTRPPVTGLKWPLGTGWCWLEAGTGTMYMFGVGRNGLDTEVTETTG